MTNAAVLGHWLKTPRPEGLRPDSIHDDGRAQALGFKAALVPGTIPLALATALLVERFGQAWYERGFLQQSYREPVYAGDEIRATLQDEPAGEHDQQLVRLVVEKRESAPATVGYAGLSLPGAAPVPPWQRAGEAVHAPRGEDPLPNRLLGDFAPVEEVAADGTEHARTLALVGDQNPWYAGASPWGGPVLPSVGLITLGWGDRAERVRLLSDEMRSGIIGEVSLVHHAPVLCAERYLRRSTLIDKGSSGRTAFITTEFGITRPDGTPVAESRWTIRWFRRQAGPAT